MKRRKGTIRFTYNDHLIEYGKMNVNDERTMSDGGVLMYRIPRLIFINVCKQQRIMSK